MELMARIDTEIDWRAYIQQVEQYRNGERDYTLIKGDTGWTPKFALIFLFLNANLDTRSSGLPSSAFIHIQHSVPYHGQRDRYFCRSVYIRCCISWRLEHGYGLLPHGQGMRVSAWDRKASDTLVGMC